MERTIEPFEFRECVSLLKATGKKAKTLSELRDVIAKVSDRSLFHHTYEHFLKGHILEYTNDFAQWAGEFLEERALSEELSNIDPYACKDMAELRKVLLDIIDVYIERFPEPREAMAGDEFYFNETVTLVFPAGLWAKNLAEFLMAIKYIDTGSLYYHFYEARLRLGAGVDDFSKWFEASGKKELSQTVRAIDPFMHSMEGIRERIAHAVEEEVRKDMATIGGTE
ncbi:MAG: DUF5752 family protein [bacterium]